QKKASLPENGTLPESVGKPFDLLFVFAEEPSEQSLLLLGRGLQMTADAADAYDVKAADVSLDFFFYRDQIKDLLVCNENGDLGSDLGFDDRQLGTSHKLRRLVNDHVRKSAFLHGMPLLIDQQHRNGLFCCFDLSLLFLLFLLRLLSPEIKADQQTDKDNKNNKKDNCNWI